MDKDYDARRNMQRYVDTTSEEIARTQEQPLRERFKTFKSPVKNEQEREQMYADVSHAVSQFAQSDIPSSVANEAATATPKERKATLDKQRGIIKRMRAEHGMENKPERRPAQGVVNGEAGKGFYPLPTEAEVTGHREEARVVQHNNRKPLPMEQRLIDAGKQEFATLGSEVSKPDYGEYNSITESEAKQGKFGFEKPAQQSKNPLGLYDPDFEEENESNL